MDTEISEIDEKCLDQLPDEFSYRFSEINEEITGILETVHSDDSSFDVKEFLSECNKSVIIDYKPNSSDILNTTLISNKHKAVIAIKANGIDIAYHYIDSYIKINIIFSCLGILVWKL